MSEGSPAAESYSVLLAAGSDTLRAWAEPLLQQAGYRTTCAAEGLSALRVLEAGAVDMALVAQELPLVTGIELCRTERELGERGALPMVLLAPAADLGAPAAGLAAGFDDVLRLPCPPAELLLRVRSALRAAPPTTGRQLELAVRERTQELRQTLAQLALVEQELRSSREETIGRLARAAEFRDDESAQHIERMSRYCSLMAGLLGMDAEQSRTLALASQLHDVGKLATPDRILFKAARLSPQEFVVMMRHAEVGQRILGGSSSELLELAATIAWTHHERYDGGGYPRRIAGADIPLAGRITAIADVFDALVSERIYKPAYTMERSLEILRSERGRHFDPELLDLFLGAASEVQAICAGHPDQALPRTPPTSTP